MPLPAPVITMKPASVMRRANSKAARHAGVSCRSARRAEDAHLPYRAVRREHLEGVAQLAQRRVQQFDVPDAGPVAQQLEARLDHLANETLFAGELALAPGYAAGARSRGSCGAAGGGACRVATANPPLGVSLRAIVPGTVASLRAFPARRPPVSSRRGRPRATFSRAMRDELQQMFLERAELIDGALVGAPLRRSTCWSSARPAPPSRCSPTRSAAV